MGKKQSRTSQKKQTKATNSSSSRKHKTASSAFGVPVTKSSGSFAATLKRRKQMCVDTTHKNTDNNNTQNYELQFRRRRHDATQQYDFFSQPKDQEHCDFEEEYASLRERQRHSINVRLSSKTTNKSKSQHELKFFPSTHQQGMVNGKSRSTEDLIMDATNRLSFGSINIGGGGRILQLEPHQWGNYERKQQQPSNLLQAMVANTRCDTRLNLPVETADNNMPVKNNKCWALQDDYLDKEEDGKGSGDSSSRFQFTPASFSIAPPPSTSMVAVLACGVDDHNL